MPKTAVGLLMNPSLVEEAVREIETLGLPRQEVRIAREPFTFPVNGVTSFTRLEHEAELTAELLRIGASASEIDTYLQGLRNGGALVLASGADQQVEAAAGILNEQGALDVENSSGFEPEIPEVEGENAVPDRETTFQVGRLREDGMGARLFVW